MDEGAPKTIPTSCSKSYCSTAHTAYSISCFYRSSYSTAFTSHTAYTALLLRDTPISGLYVKDRIFLLLRIDTTVNLVQPFCVALIALSVVIIAYIDSEKRDSHFGRDFVFERKFDKFRPIAYSFFSCSNGLDSSIR